MKAKLLDMESKTKEPTSEQLLSTLIKLYAEQCGVVVDYALEVDGKIIKKTTRKNNLSQTIE